MTLEQSTRAKIDELAKAIITGHGEQASLPQGAYVVIITPRHDAESAPDLLGREGMALFDEQAKLYQEALASLEEDQAVEHLTHANLRDALASFVVNLETDKEQITGRRARSERIDQFVSEIVRPLSTYEVAFSIDNITLDAEPLRFGNVEFREFSLELAEDWGIVKFQSELHDIYGDIIGKPVGIVTVEAGTVEKAFERAEDILNRALHVLRVSIGSFRPSLIYDKQLFQRRGHLRAMRQLQPEPKLWRGVKHPSAPIHIELSGALLESTRDFTAQLNPVFDGDGTMKPRLQDALLRSLEWIGTSITREDYDHKVVDLCAALEAVLTTKDDRRKGEAVALRVMLLAMALGKGFRHPGQLHRLYVLRSNVVHGAALGECGRSDYETLRYIAEETVLNVIELNDTQGPLARPIDVVRHLETLVRLAKTTSWLDHETDDNTKEVAKYAKWRLKERCK